MRRIVNRVTVTPDRITIDGVTIFNNKGTRAPVRYYSVRKSHVDSRFTKYDFDSDGKYLFSMRIYNWRMHTPGYTVFYDICDEVIHKCGIQDGYDLLDAVHSN